MRAAAGAGNGRGPQQAVWRGTAVLRRRWPPSTCQGAAPCGLRLFAGGGGWCCYGAETHAMRSVTACNRRPPSSTSSSTSGLSRPVLPRQLWRVVGWVGFLSGVERVHINIGTWGLCDRLCLVLVCRGRYGWGGVLLFILGSSLGGVGPVVRGLREGGRGEWCEEWARSG